MQLDTRLKWHAHVREIEKKMTKQTLALAKVTTSTWGATFIKAQHVYTAVVRPAMTYGSTVWHAPKKLKGFSKSAEDRLAIVQNKCLQLISGRYKATPIQALKAEMFIPPISSHLMQLQAKSRFCMQSVEQAKFIAKACKRVAAKLKSNKDPQQMTTETLEQHKYIWAQSIMKHNSSTPTLPLLQPPKPPLP